MKQLIISITESYYKKAIEYRLDAPTMIVEAIRHGTPLDDVLDKIRAEISEYKDDKIIHAERNEMIDIVIEIIDRYRNEVSKE